MFRDLNIDMFFHCRESNLLWNSTSLYKVYEHTKRERGRKIQSICNVGFHRCNKYRIMSRYLQALCAIIR